ncbi:MAG: DNA-processing protein DprA [Acidimicrobiales bacterium]
MIPELDAMTRWVDPMAPVGVQPLRWADDAQLAAATALAGLRAMGPRRLSAVLRGRTPLEAWDQLIASPAGARKLTFGMGSTPDGGEPPARESMATGDQASRPGHPGPGPVPSRRPGTGSAIPLQELASLWHRQAAATELVEVQARLEASGIHVGLLGWAGYPPVLAEDPQAPEVLFWRGDQCLIPPRRVAVVGTRRATAYGLGVARSIGRDLAEAGVGVVSGLALGIDGAVHSGALGGLGHRTCDSSSGDVGVRPSVRPAGSGRPDSDVSRSAGSAPVIGVVGSGLDVIYPRDHAGLWDRVAEEGFLCSESPPGAAPEPWRFPSRNRIIAALGQVMVVVESHSRGGSRHSIDAAAERGRPVMAVPGPVTSPASDLPNQLLMDGCSPVRDADDVLAALGLELASGERRPRVPVEPPEGESGRVLNSLGCEGSSLDQVVAASGLDVMAVTVALAGLLGGGWVSHHSGWWARTHPHR